MRNTSILSRSIATRNIILSPAEIATYYRYRVPELRQRAHQWRGRGRCPIHHGDGFSFSVNSESGFAYCHSECGRGWDVMGLEIALTGVRYPEAVRELGSIIGRDLVTHTPKRPRYSREELVRAELFALGLGWRLDRALTIFKRRLWTSAHRWAAPRVRVLTDWERQMGQWSVYDALRVMRVMNKRIVQECVTEAQEFHDLIQHADGNEERAA